MSINPDLSWHPSYTQAVSSQKSSWPLQGLCGAGGGTEIDPMCYSQAVTRWMEKYTNGFSVPEFLTILILPL